MSFTASMPAHDMEELKRFHQQLDIIAEGYRAQSVAEEM